MSRREILREVAAAERDACDLLAEAARLTTDPEDRRLFLRLAALEEETVRELAREQERLEAEEFVQKALDV
jgi:hypothetical protein